MLVFTDLETSGLDPQKNSLLEVAVIITDDALREVARFEQVVYWEGANAIVDLLNENADESCFAELGVHPVVIKMHRDNGLWAKVPNGTALATVDRELAAFIREHAVTRTERTDPATGEIQIKDDLPQLAGSTISFDRAFIAVHLPKTLAVLHYRNVDVSSFNETARRFWPAIYEARPRGGNKAHRGMADIEESIAVYKHYLASLAPVTQNHDGTGRSTVTITQVSR